MAEAMTEKRRYGLITEEEVAKIRARIGKELPINQSFVTYVNEDSIFHAVRSIGDDNGLWFDEDQRATKIYGGRIAPPALLYGVAWGAWDMRHGDGLPGVHGLHAGDDWHYFRPALAGDRLHATKQILRLQNKEGEYAGKILLQDRLMRILNEKDELVATQEMHAIRSERDAARKRGKYSDIKRASYTADDIAALDDEVEAQNPRGQTPLFFDDVNEGDAVPVLTKGPIGIADMMAWMMGAGSPHVRSGRFWLAYRRRAPRIAVADPRTGVPAPVERVHWDEYMAAEIGMPAPYDYGPQRGAFATHFMTNWVGDRGWLAALSIRYRSMVFIDDVLRFRGTVTRKWRGERSGNGFVECEFKTESQRGVNVMPGRAVVVLPDRDRDVVFPIDRDELYVGYTPAAA